MWQIALTRRRRNLISLCPRYFMKNMCLCVQFVYVEATHKLTACMQRIHAWYQLNSVWRYSIIHTHLKILVCVSCCFLCCVPTSNTYGNIDKIVPSQKPMLVVWKLSMSISHSTRIALPICHPGCRQHSNFAFRKYVFIFFFWYLLY